MISKGSCDTDLQKYYAAQLSTLIIIIRSCDTEYWSIDAENSALIIMNKWNFKIKSTIF